MSDNGTGVHTFKLTDRRGLEHDYLVTEHPAGDGMAVMYDLLALGAPSVLALAGAALASEDVIAAVLGALSADAPALGSGELGKLISGVNLAQAGAELGKALATGKGPELTRRILSRCFRDGRSLAGIELETAYQANYSELLAAVWKVCQINGFFPLPSTLSSSPTARAKTTLAPET